MVAADEDMKEALHGRSVSFGMSLTHFTTMADCREALDADPCHLLVVNLDGDAVAGLELLGDMDAQCAHLPKLALVDQGDIATAVQAIRAGAANCLEKPVETERFLVEMAVLLREADRNARLLKPNLTPMEVTVLNLLLEGKTNSEAARVLHRSPRTVEVHRRHVMRKFAVTNAVDLVKAATAAGYFRV